LFASVFAGLAEGVWYWPLPHAGVPEIVSGQYQTPSVCDVLCLRSHVSLVPIVRTKLQSNEQTISNLKQRGLLVRRVMISVPSMKNPPYQQPVLSPARTLDEPEPLTNDQKAKTNKNPATEDGG
jgi:hypothetical protein